MKKTKAMMVAGHICTGAKPHEFSAPSTMQLKAAPYLLVTIESRRPPSRAVIKKAMIFNNIVK